MNWRLVLFAITIGLCSPAMAGYTELGLAGSYKKSFFDDPSYDESSSWTGSIDYVFAAQSAVEVSYTDGSSTRYLHFDDPSLPDETTTIYYQMAALDLVISLLGPENQIRPYIKVGGAYIIKKDIIFERAGTIVPVAGQPGTDTGLVPSAGAGIRIDVTKEFSLKAEVEGWASAPANTTGHWDVIGHVGVSWML